jgi:chromosomal replication initiator protein
MNEFWGYFENYLKDNIKLGKPSFDTFVASSKPVSFQNNVLTVLVTGPVQKTYWETRLQNYLVEAAFLGFDTEITPEFVTPEEFDELKELSPVSAAVSNLPEAIHETVSSQLIIKNSELNPKYTFDTFVIGKGNQMAHAAALVVAEEPGSMYNPLFLYGGVGLGKTHLMHAIGNQLLETRGADYKIRYISSETFTNDFIESLRHNKAESFREEYRSIDLLLIDDIQFFAGKEAVQEEFFHTFEALYNNHKQIVLTSDRNSRDIPGLTQRLVSRFAWGLPVDITPPDLETRIAILRNKADSENIEIPDDTLTYIAGAFSDNVRELEGALIRVQAFATISGQDITTSLAAEALKSLKSHANLEKITIKEIQEVVAKYYGVTVADLTGKQRMKNFTVPRQIAMYFARELTDNSLPKVGNEFGKRDHTTVMHAVTKITENLKTDEHLQKEIDEIRGQLKG